VVHELERRMFNDEAIPYLVGHLNEYQQLASRQSKEEAAGLKYRLSDVDRQIGHIVTAVSKGFTQPTFMQKLSELEEDKALLEVIIYNDHVEVIFKLDAAGVAIDGTNHEDFAASLDKQELFRLSSDAV
jgi:hypothetical protein